MSHEYKAALALDLGTYCGWAIRHADGSLTSGEMPFTPKKDDAEGTRLWRYFTWLRDKVRTNRIQRIYFEDVLFQSSQKQTRLWSGWLTCTLLVGQIEQIGTRGFGTNVVKLTASGHGGAGKPRMQRAAKDCFDLNYLPEENEADALCTLFTGELWAAGKLDVAAKKKKGPRAGRGRKNDSQQQLFTK